MVEFGGFPAERDEHGNEGWRHTAPKDIDRGFQQLEPLPTYMTVSDTPLAEGPNGTALPTTAGARSEAAVSSIKNIFKRVNALPVLPRAEDMDPQELRSYAAGMLRVGEKGSPRWISAQLRAASLFTEVGLASISDAEAEDAFGQSDGLYAAVIPQLDLQNPVRLRAERMSLHVPVMRLRRAGAGREEIAAAAYGALATSIARVLPIVEDQNVARGASGGRLNALGTLAEDSVAALVARSGEPVYISSEREDSGRLDAEGMHFASDFHELDSSDKVPVEVKYKNDGKIRGTDPPVAVIRYLPHVCGPIASERFAQHARPSVYVVGVHIARLLSQEGTGAGASDNLHGRHLLDRGTELVKNRIDNWKHNRPQSK